MNDLVTHGEFISDHKLWGRVLFYDYRDSLGVQAEAASRAAVYFKRSWFDAQRNRVSPSWVKPVSHCALNEYYAGPVEPDLGVGCFFDINNKNIGIRRRNILVYLMGAGFDDSLIGMSTAFGGVARLSIEDAVAGNPFYEFLGMQRRCKIVFTAQPEKVEGDNRTWEAFASGALVFRDVSHMPVPNPTLDGVHCVVYDATNPGSIADAVDKARHFLADDGERKRIALAGYDHVLKHHRPKNRVTEMLNTFKLRPKVF